MDTLLLGRQQLLERAVRHLEADRGVVLAGLPWVGRTRILREALRRVGAPFVMCRATISGRDTPFSCLGELAPGDPSSPATWLDELHAKLPAPDAIVAIDGAQFLDDASALLVLRAAEEGEIRLAVSVWRSHPAPDAVTSLWTDGLLPRIEVEPVDREASDEIARQALGGPVEEATLLRLWDRCRGYPLLLREYIAGSRDAGVLVERDGLWISLGRLVHTPTLIDTARQVRIGLPPEAVDALDLLAVAEPLDPLLADRIVDRGVLSMLERWDLFVPDEEGRYRLPAPGWAQSLRAGLSAATRRGLAARLAAAAPPTDKLHGEELIRVAGWHLQAGLPLPPAELIRAAETARDRAMPDEAGLLARAVLDDVPIRARMVLADVLAKTDPEGAVGLLTEVAELTPDHVEAANALLVAARLEFLRVGRTDVAIALLRNGLGRTDDVEARALVQGELSLFFGLLGDLREASELAGRLVREAGHGPRVRYVANRAATVAAMYLGEFAEARRSLAAGELAAAELGPSAETALAFAGPVIELMSGRPAIAARLAEQAYRDHLERGFESAAAVWAMAAASAQVAIGDLQAADVRSVEAIRLAERDDPFGTMPTACGVRALVAATGGRLAEARRWLSRLDQVRRTGEVRVSFARDQAVVLVRALEGDVEGASRFAVTAAQESAERDQRVWASLLAYDAVRFGYPELALDVLRSVAPGVEGDMATLQLSHAEAVVAGDADAVERIADRWFALGFRIWGTEAMIHAAELHVRAERAGRGALLQARASTVLEELGGVRTPALRGIGTEPLTRRERQVALLAADGRTSPEIAERLVVSVRTVDNHLASVYRKLGISGRHELGYVMAGS